MAVSTLKNVLIATEAARKKGKKIVATNGCFDILHVGHVRNLEAAKKLGDILVVGVNSDASVRTNKGDLRPIVPARERASVLAGLKSVDHVFIFSTPTPFSWIKRMSPDVHVKGADLSQVKDLEVQKAVVEKVGGKFVLLRVEKGKSTTNIIEKIRRAYQETT